MKNKGFTLIELIIATFIISIVASVVIPGIFKFMKDEKVAQKTGELVREFKNELDPEVKSKPVKLPPFIKCFEGRQVIEISGKMYHIGNIDTWGDIKSIECN